MKKIIYALLATSLLMTACSSTNSSYQKNLKESIKLMNDMEYDKAIETLRKTIDKDLTGDRFKARRSELAYNLIDEAEYMSEHIESLAATYEETIAEYNDFKKEESSDFEAVYHVYRSLEDAINQFSDLTQLDMYKELDEASKDIEKLATEAVTSLEQEFNDSLKENKFTKSEQALNDLSKANDYLPESILGEDLYTKLDEMEQQLEEAKEKYAFLPTEVTKWEKEIVKNDFGSITQKGIKENDYNYELFVSLTDGFAKAISELTIEPSFILKDGSKIDNAKINEIVYGKDETLLLLSLNKSEERTLDDIVRVDWNIPSLKEESFQLDYDAKADDRVELPGIEAVVVSKNPEIKIEKDKLTIDIHSLEVDKGSVTLAGKIIPKEDVEIKDFVNMMLPLSRTANLKDHFYAEVIELYKGTEKEFSFQTDLDTPITASNNISYVNLFGEPLVLDLAEGKVIDGPEQTFLYDRAFDVSSKIFIGDDYQSLLINQDNKAVDFNSAISSINRYSYDRFFLNNEFETFTTTFHVLEKNKNMDYEDITITFTILDEDRSEIGEKKTFTISKGHKPTDVSIDVKGAYYLDVNYSSPFGGEGNPGIILEKPYVK